MQVALFLDSSRFGEWSVSAFERGDTALSGSDASGLWLAEALAARGIRVRLGVTRLPTDPRPHHVHVAGPIEALEASRGSDVVLAAHGTAMGDPARYVAAAESLGLPLIVWGHNAPGPELELLYERSPAVRRFVCVSNVQGDGMRDKRLFAKCAVVFNALSTDAWARAARPPEREEVCFLGSISHSKGFHLLAAAWGRVRAELPAATLRVFGSAHLYDRGRPLGPLGIGEPFYELPYLVPHLGSSREEARARGVVLHGLSTPRETAALAAGAALGVVNPSFTSTETFCLAAVELQALGLPVLGARAGGLLETVAHGRSGHLVARGEDLAAAIVRLLRDVPGRARMSEEARRHVERFAPARVLETWIELLAEVARGEPAHPPRFLGHPHARDAYLRECVRVSRVMPWLGPRLPSLAEARDRARAIRRRVSLRA